MNKRKIIAIITLTVFIFSWSLSDFARVPLVQFPPKIKEVKAAAPTYVGGASATGNSANFDVSLTGLTGGSGSSAAAGDLVVVVDGFVSTANLNPGVSTGGYTEEADLYASDSDDANLSVNWKIMPATPDSAVTCLGSTVATNGTACVVQVWRGVDQTTPMDVTVTTAVPGNNIGTSVPDAPLISPVTQGAIVLAVGVGADAAADTAVTAPTGYGNQVHASVDPGLAVRTSIASKAWSGAGDENPDVWTGVTTTTAGSWTAATLALRPATTTLADGTDPTAAPTVAPGATGNYLDQFTFVSTGYGGDTVTALTVTTANTAAIASMQIWNDAMSTQYFATVSSPTGNDWSFSGGTAIPVTSSAAAFRVVFTAKDHTLGSGTYAVTGTVSSTFTTSSTYNHAGSDADSDTVTVDNLGPNGATSVSGTGGNTQVTINWTTSNSSDFNTTSGSVVYRWASGSAGSEVPAENSTPTVGTTNGTATVACVVSSAASTPVTRVDGASETDCTTAALTNGQQYTYKVFQKDTNGNYDVGVSIGTFTPAAAQPAFTQNDFEWFIDEATVTLTDAWPSGSLNLAELEVFTQLPAAKRPLVSGGKIRIQINLTIATANLSINTQNFALQYTAGTDCTTAGGWADVGAIASGTIWRFYDNASLTDGVTQVNQISTSTAGAEGDFVESNATQNNPNAVNIGQSSEWDFAVENNGAAENTTYCFRMTRGDAGRTVLNTYNGDSYPKLTTAPGNANLLRHGNFFSDSNEKGFWWTD